MKNNKPDLLQIEQALRSHSFVTPKFLQNAHVQTFLPRIAPYFKTKLPEMEKKFIDLPDGSKLIADCWWQENKEKHQTIVILGGIEGYKREKTSHFVINMLNKAFYFKYNVIHLKHRAEGDSIYHTKSIGYNLNDLPLAFEQIKAWSVKKFFVIAYSIGGYLLLFALGNLGKKAQGYILGAVSISAPTRVFETWNHVEKNVLYNQMLLKFYKSLVSRRAKIDSPGTWNLKELKRIKTKLVWGEKYKNYWGYPNRFKTLNEAAEAANAGIMLPKIKIPTLIINSYDDSLSPIADFLTLNNPNTIKLLTKRGGHGGFYMTKKLYGDLDGHWAQNRAIEFVKLIAKNKP